MAAVTRLIEQQNFEQGFPILNQLKAQAPRLKNVDYFRALCFLHRAQVLAAIEALKEELRFFPDNSKAATLLQTLAHENAVALTLGDPEFRQLAQSILPYTMLSEARLLSLFELAKKVCEEDLPGQFVECGVAAGGSASLLAVVLRRYSQQPRRLFAFDTFEGMPATSRFDTHAGQKADETGWGQGTCAAPQASVQEVCRKLGVEAFVELVPGLFAATLPVHRQRIGPIALLHMDGDWYASTRDILENLYQNVISGGVIQIDDYGHWEGCKKAVDEFAQKRQLRFEFHRIDQTGVWLRKQGSP